ncbi:MAG: hypothetical protein AB1327_05045 [Bacillota bacterium]|uniref:hypothetical protein n=1 Tax=Desulforudis sp. DRI-14 TaxID=3459793 RepID=UPI003481E540
MSRNRRTAMLVLRIVPLADARQERAVYISALSELAKWLVKTASGAATDNGVIHCEKRSR